MLGKAGSSKNMKKFFVFLLVVICLGMGAGVVYMKSSEDNEGPKITFEEGKDTNYTSDMTEEDLLKVKHQVRPGLTGWAQVNGYRGDTSIRKRIECDLYYIENWSVGFDIKIMFLTIFKGFINKNAY